MKRKPLFALLCMLCMLSACTEFDDFINNGGGDNIETPNDPEDPDTPENYGDKFFNNTLEPYKRGVDELYKMLVNSDNSGVGVYDVGMCQLTRSFFTCQEITTDECYMNWYDDYVLPMQTNTYYEGDNSAIIGVFFRTMQLIAFSDEYLRQTATEVLDRRGVADEIKSMIEVYRAEVRVIRALCYWIAIDSFREVPFALYKDEAYIDLNTLTPREEVYAHLVTELEELVSNGSPLPAAQTLYTRMDKGAALGLLSRLYLNAEVYTGVAEWEKCKSTCERIFSLGYRLAPTYAELFRGDNGENPDAYGEFLMAIPYDFDTMTYGGSMFILNASSCSSDCHLAGLKYGGWAGMRLEGEFVERFFDVSNVNFASGSYDCDDARGKIFYIYGNKGGKITNTDELYDYYYGWKNFKFSNIHHDQTVDTYTYVNSNSSIDLPIIRLGEIYLNYAEACVRMGNGAVAQSKMNELAQRTGVAALVMPMAWDATARDMFVAERARELMWEMCRRTDLIRYDLYSGDEYIWPFKGGNTAEGQPFAKDLEVFPLPTTFIANNPDMLNLETYYKALIAE